VYSSVVKFLFAADLFPAARRRF